MKLSGIWFGNAFLVFVTHKNLHTVREMVIPTRKQLYKFYSITEKSLLFSVKAAEHIEISGKFVAIVIKCIVISLLNHQIRWDD